MDVAGVDQAVAVLFGHAKGGAVRLATTARSPAAMNRSVSV